MNYKNIVPNIVVSSGKYRYNVASQQGIHISKLKLCDILFIKGTCKYVRTILMSHRISKHVHSDNIWIFYSGYTKKVNKTLEKCVLDNDDLHVSNSIVNALMRKGYNNIYNHANQPYTLVLMFTDNNGNVYPAYFGYDPHTLINMLVDKYNNYFYGNQSKTRYLRGGYSYKVYNNVTSKSSKLHVKVYFNAYDKQCPLLIIILTLDNSKEEYISSIRIDNDTVRSQKLVNIDLCPEIWGFIQNKDHHLTDFFKILRNKLEIMNFGKTNNHDKDLVKGYHTFNKVISKAKKNGKSVHKDNLYIYWKDARNIHMANSTYYRILNTTNINKRLLMSLKEHGFTLFRTQYLSKSKSLKGILKQFRSQHKYL